ncbi:MAG: sulfatase-like hydrolase/transferase [Lentisphaerae bacterium]|nr:sulfatase-like hydrolase/transferase [Lentisphaerota bacterium]
MLKAISRWTPFCIILVMQTLCMTSWAQDKPNVLFIMCDDLNDYVTGFGGHPQAKTPAVEKLAKSGTLFSRAYCNFPACAPSRNGMLHGLYPHSASSAWKSRKQLPAFKGNICYNNGQGRAARSR